MSPYSKTQLFEQRRMSQPKSSDYLTIDVDEIVQDGGETDEESDSDAQIVFDDSDYSDNEGRKNPPRRKPSRTRSSSRHNGSSDNGGSGNLTKINGIRRFKKRTNCYEYDSFFKDLLDKNWTGIQTFASTWPKSLTAEISLLKQETFFHIITRDLDVPGWLIEELTSRFSSEGLEHCRDESGRSPLFWAAMYGNKKAAEAFVRRNRKLTTKTDGKGLLPIHVAASCGHKDVIKYLLSETRIRLDDERGVTMLKDLIKAGLYGIALDLLKRYPALVGESENRGSVLTLLAKKPLAFDSGSKLRYWERFIYRWIPVQEEHISFPDLGTVGADIEDCTEFLFAIGEVTDTAREIPAQEEDISSPDLGTVDGDYIKNPTTDRSTLREPTDTARGSLLQKLLTKLWNSLMLLVPSIKSIHDTKLTHRQTLEIVRVMCHESFTWKKKEALKSLSMPILIAARYGICELVEEILKAYFYSYTFINQSTGHGIFHLSILRRQEKVFNLLNKMNLRLWHWKAARTGGENNENILHLAGRLVPSTRVSGAALQMQRELQWFKAVESYVHPSLLERQNKSGKTPREVFTKNHKSLVKEGEKWMKGTATSCTIVAALIITIMFAAAFTSPGGNDTRGFPNFLHEPSFIVFVVSDAFALFSSSASLLMFLGILTSRYSEEDFLEPLPKKLISGLITLFFSVASMMVAFGAAIYILLSDKWPLVYIPMAILGGLTATLFARLQFPLLVELYSSTYCSSIHVPTQ